METLWLTALRVQAHLLVPSSRRRGDRNDRDDRDDRGDVPGWVLVTMMTVGLVIAITSIATDQLSDILRSALNRVR